MKITIELEGVTASVECEAFTFPELADLFDQCALAVGFLPDTVKEHYED